eukprot:jgi/Tetstr1/430538/TSEL_020336.t1
MLGHGGVIGEAAAAETLPAEVVVVGGGEESSHEEGDEGVPTRNRPRRKATEKPTGADAQRQSFSKRKKGLAAKAYQLHRLTEAKVAVFIVNEKGSSWAYASPGFGAAVSPAYLSMMRKLADLPTAPKVSTEASFVQPFMQTMYKLPSSNPNQAMAMLQQGYTTTGQTIGHPTAQVSLVPQGALELQTDPSQAGMSTQAQHQQHTMTLLQQHTPMYPAAFHQGTPMAVMTQPSQVLPGLQAVEIATHQDPPEMQHAMPHTVSEAAQPGSEAGKRSAEKDSANEEGAPPSKQSKHAAPSGTEQQIMQKPLVSLTRQHAIVPAQAPPPEGLFGKHHH